MQERRARTLTDEDLNALAATMHGGMSADEHADHHRMFETWIARENRKAEFREKVRAQVGGWGVITALTGIGYAAWEGFKGVIRMKGGS